MGGGGCGFGRSQLATHSVKKRPERAGARAETLGGHVQRTARAILPPSTAGGKDFTATNAVVWTES